LGVGDGLTGVLHAIDLGTPYLSHSGGPFLVFFPGISIVSAHVRSAIIGPTPHFNQ
jgi:hypothetical protein